MAGVTYPNGELKITGEVKTAKLAPWSDYGVLGNGKPIIGGIYRHFKGGVYQVLDIVRDADDGKTEYVTYVNLMYGEKWLRSVEEFMSDVDAEKYPEFAGQPRLELVGKPQHLMK